MFSYCVWQEVEAQNEYQKQDIVLAFGEGLKNLGSVNSIVGSLGHCGPLSMNFILF